jgi:NADPH-dependent 2,4-dienoyl-CoA reductase/sulfur reductase-like enzyme
LPKSQRTVIIGASMAGLRTAEALGRGGYEGEILILGAEAQMPYNRPPLSKGFLNDSVQETELAFEIREGLEKVRWELGNPAMKLNPERNSITDSRGLEHEFDNLVIATGVSPRRNPAFGSNEQNSLVLRTLEDAHRLRRNLKPGKRLVIQGAGFVGAEVAAMASEMGCDVTLISSSDRMLKRQLGDLVGNEAQRRHVERGVKVRVNSSVASVRFDGGEAGNLVTSVELADGELLECDVFLQATGSIPNTEWLTGSGLEITDGVLCDSTLRAMSSDGSATPNIFAVGDVAKFANPLFDATARRVEQWNIPGESARRVAQEILRAASAEETAPQQPFAPVPSFWSDQFDLSFFGMGLPHLADRTDLFAGELEDKFVVGYFRGEQLFAVCGSGMRGAVQAYRNQIGAKWVAAE